MINPIYRPNKSSPLQPQTISRPWSPETEINLSNATISQPKVDRVFADNFTLSLIHIEGIDNPSSSKTDARSDATSLL